MRLLPDEFVGFEGGHHAFAERGAGEAVVHHNEPLAGVAGAHERRLLAGERVSDDDPLDRNPMRVPRRGIAPDAGEEFGDDAFVLAHRVSPAANATRWRLAVAVAS